MSEFDDFEAICEKQANQRLILSPFEPLGFGKYRNWCLAKMVDLAEYEIRFYGYVEWLLENEVIHWDNEAVQLEIDRFNKLRKPYYDEYEDSTFDYYSADL